ncbi:MAG: hypothetical protein JJU29_06760 [Verrucomicrobia bacterium]|nr:hypothetical protein [Verrucomicrobiota bacterium]MCH8511575.1 hypothetical protein [Kiritimatiellia bacterium]
MNAIKSSLHWIVLVWMCHSLALAQEDTGRLRRFERGSGTPRPPRERSQTRESKDTSPSATDSFLVELVDALVFRPIVYGLATGGEFAHDLSDKRMLGDPMFPLLRFDVGAQYISSDIHALGYGFELGKAVLAADFRHTFYRDRIFEDTLHQFQYHALYRMAAHRRTQLDIALGAMTLQGDNRQTALSMGVPMRYWPSKSIGVELRPLWAFFPDGTLMDVEAGILLRYEHSSVRLGYRWVERGDETLSGPRIGMSFRF